MRHPHDPAKPGDILQVTLPESGESPDASGDSTRTSIPREPDVPSTRWGTLTILAELGHGAYGHVYRAWDEVLARDVALKLIRIQSVEPEAAADVLREGQMLARVRHQNIVTVYGAQRIGEHIGIWMELVSGRSLREMVRQDGPLAAEEAAMIGLSLCHALTAVHGAGLLHRDIKAQNVMRESGGRIVLMDFGAGRERSAVQAGWAEMAGTPLYMPPEVLAGHPWSAAGDVYSLGALMYFLVTGHHPVEGKTVPEIVLAHERGERQLLIDRRPGLPAAFVAVVERALAPPDRRYRTAGAMMHDLTDAIAGGMTTPGGAGYPVSHPGADTTGAASQSNPQSGSLSTATTTGAPPSPVLRWFVGAAAVLAVVWMLGFVTSMAFDSTLGRSSDFTGESPLDWLVWGFRSLIGPALYVALALLAYMAVRLVVRVAERWIPPVRRAMAAMRARVARTDRNTRAQWLLWFQIVIVAIVLWRFRALLAACAGFSNTFTDDPLGPLRPDSGEPVRYRAALSIVMLVALVSWHRLLRREPGAADSGRIDLPTVGAGIALIVLVALLMAAPFRLVYQNAFPRVEFAGERCYVTGQRGAVWLLFCPDTAPQIRLVRAPAPEEQHVTIVESIFTRPSPGR